MAGRATQRLGRFLQARSLGEKLHRVGRSLFPQPARLAELYNLPPESGRVWAKYLVRPFHVLGRHMGLVAGVALRRQAAIAAAEAKAEQLRLDEWLTRPDPPATGRVVR